MSKNRKLVRGRRAVVLLVEDSDNDIELTKLAFEHNEFAVDVHVTRDGEQCMAFLERQSDYANSPQPDLILLDLHMPKMSGLEVLKAINTDPQLRHIPVIVLTTSNSESDVLEAYRRCCSGYVIKPLGFAEFVTAVQSLEQYWFALVDLPLKGKNL